MSKYSALFNAADRTKELVLSAEKYLWAHPETGYREWKSSEYLAGEYEKLGYKLIRAVNIPGFYTVLDTGVPGPTILMLSELDSLICRDHPDADPETGAVHACGHNAQGAALLGVAAILKQPETLDGLCGKIILCAVPAEELIETGYRETLRSGGTIGYFGGKVEFLSRGYFDGADMAIMVHTAGSGSHSMGMCKGGNGCIVKNIAFKGVASHAGASPDAGVNALYAANIGLNAINALRETFRDSDHVRVHPIITYGGTAVNAIPSDIRLESYVRGADYKIIAQINRKVNRALAASAASIGAGVLLSDRPGYSPLLNDVNLYDLSGKAMAEVVPKQNVHMTDRWDTGCTDMGDLSAVMPAVHAYCGGASGTGHGKDYKISDAESACVDSAKFQLAMLHMLLSEGAAEANRIIALKNPRYPSFAEYFKFINSLAIDRDAVKYRGDGNVELLFV